MHYSQHRHSGIDEIPFRAVVGYSYDFVTFSIAKHIKSIAEIAGIFNIIL
jgi:hypothetical protein